MDVTDPTHNQHYCLRWNNHRSNLLTVFDELLHNEEFSDVTLAVDDGRMVNCHRIVLAACSTYFQTLFTKLPPNQHPIIVLKDVRDLEIKAILEYMYRGEVNVAHEQLSALLTVAQVLKVKGLVEEHENSRTSTARDLRREDTTMNTQISPPPTITTSTGGGGNGSNSPPSYSSLYERSAISHDRAGQSHLANSLLVPGSWPPLPLAGHQLPTHSTPVLGSGSGGGSGGGVGGSYDNGIEYSPPLKVRKLQSSLLMNNDTPILRGVLGQSHVDSSQAMPLLQPDSHEPHYRNASSNGSANDCSNRRSNDLAHSETVHTDVSYVDEDERQPSPQSYSADTVRNSAAADCPQPKPEWKRYKQYTRDDITAAIEAVRRGMSAVQAARKYGVPSRTLYDKVKKLGIQTSRPLKRSSSNGGSGASFPYGMGANANGDIYNNSVVSANILYDNDSESGSGNINIAEGCLAGTSAPVFKAASYAKTTKDTSRDSAMSADSMASCSSSPVIRCAKQRQQQQQELEDQVEDLSVSRKSDVPVIVPSPTTSAAIKDEAPETGLDSKDCCDYS